MTLPGYGDEKAKIFVAILGKRFGVQPDGWQDAAGKFGDDGPRSVADITDPTSLGKVREWKKAAEGRQEGQAGPAGWLSVTARGRLDETGGKAHIGSPRRHSRHIVGRWA